MTGLPNKELFRVEEVADYFGVTRKTIYSWIDRGTIEAEKISGSVIRITRESILQCRSPYLGTKKVSL